MSVEVTTLSDVVIIVVPRGTRMQKNIIATHPPWWREADHGDKTVLILPRCVAQHL
jgi:hypothetical protein